MVALGSGDPQSGLVGLVKARTGIAGLDEVTDGGLPRARTTLLCGGPGCGKTLMSLQFLVRGALDDAEPGVFVAFEESPAELAQNVASLGWDLGELQRRGLLAIDHVRIAESQIEETGEWDLDGLFIRLGSAIESVNAKRLVLDTVEVLFGALGNEALLRRELRRLFRWLNDRGVTSIVTGERGARTLTRHGLEEYVSDCVIVLDRRVRDQIYTRRLRVVKCRGSHHGPDEYPFLIDRAGFSVLAVSAMGLDHAASRERVSRAAWPPWMRCSTPAGSTAAQACCCLARRVGEDDAGGAVLGGRVRARRAGVAVGVRGIAGADRPQPRLRRDRPAAPHRCGCVADRRGTPGGVRARDASGARGAGRR